MDIGLIEVYNNLKNYDWDILGNYKMDHKEALKIIDYVEKQKGADNEKNN